MTTFEHAMLGVSGTMAAGLDRRYGWQIVALGGCAAVLPDWDGLSFLFGGAVFDSVHRCWGHNLLICTLLGAAVAVLEYRFHLMTRLGGLAGRLLRLSESDQTRPNPIASGGRFPAWVLVGILASLSHLAADLVFSGHKTFSDWGLKLLWPFSDHAWAFPIVHWGDVVPTLIFAAGMFAMVRWPTRLQLVARTTLVCVAGYVAVRGMVAL